MKSMVFVAALTCAQPAFALDECLLGSWIVDGAKMADTMAVQMNGSAEFISGEAFMEIAADGAVRMLVSNIVMSVQMQGAPEIEVTVNGTSNATITADAGTWLLAGGEYALVGSAFVLGQSMSIPFGSQTGMLGGGGGSFECGAQELTFVNDGEAARMPAHWFRLGG